MAKAFAYCWASGLTCVGTKAPDGAIVIAEGNEFALGKEIYPLLVKPTTRDGLYIAGVMAARNQREGVDKLIAFCKDFLAKNPKFTPKVKAKKERLHA